MRNPGDQTEGFLVKKGWPALSHLSLYTTPLFITNTTRRTAIMSLVGSPSRAMMSACMPGLSEPISLSKFRACAARELAEDHRCHGILTAILHPIDERFWMNSSALRPGLRQRHPSQRRSSTWESSPRWCVRLPGAECRFGNTPKQTEHSLPLCRRPALTPATNS